MLKISSVAHSILPEVLCLSKNPLRISRTLLTALVVFPLSLNLPRPMDKHQPLININKSKNPVTCMMNIPAESILKVKPCNMHDEYTCRINLEGVCLRSFLKFLQYQTQMKTQMQSSRSRNAKFTLTLCRNICYISLSSRSRYAGLYALPVSFS